MDSRNRPPKQDYILLELMKTHGVIRSSQAALAIGKILIADMYGQKMIDSQEPFTVFEDNGAWVITGSGGKDSCAVISLSKQDGAVLHIEVPRIPFRVWAKEP